MQLTVRFSDDELERRIRALARAEGISANQAAVRILKRGVGLGPGQQVEPGIGDRLDHLAGTWSEADALEFDEAVSAFEAIDEELWR